MTPSERRKKIAEAYELLKKTHTLYSQMLANAERLFAHPDATDEQRLEVAYKLGNTQRYLQHVHRQLLDARKDLHYTHAYSIRVALESFTTWALKK